MLTTRGWSLLLCIGILLAVGLLDQFVFSLIDLPRMARFTNTTLELLGLTLGLWFLCEWLLFAVRARLLTRRLRVERELHDERGPVDTLWSRQTFQVRVRVWLPAGLRLPYVKLADQVPHGTEPRGGDPRYEGPLHVAQPVRLEYGLRCTSIGQLRFEGVRLELADLQGFFYHATFLPDVRQYRVLPALADAAGHSPTVKRHNLLLPPGVHRLRRPGSGSELLNLRDYLPGDPPKMIAWKASARRDRLITKEFESEVPVRCTLFVDASNAVRVGQPGPTPLTRLVEIAAGVAQGSTSARDLVGLCLFDERETMYVRPARGARHLVELINRLADAAGRPPELGQAKLDTLLPVAHAFARQVYPDLLRPDVNHMPEWLPWLRPQPAYTLRAPDRADRLYQWLPVFLGLYGLAAFALLALGGAALVAAFARPPLRGTEVLITLVTLGGTTLLIVFTLLRLPTMFFPERRRTQRWRKQLAAILSVQHGLAPGGLALLMEDEALFVQHLYRFLAEHQVPCPVERYDAVGRPLLAAPEKLAVLADALLRAVSKGQDNELFVVLADLLDVSDDLEPLLRAATVAVARHHRVLVVCSWPEGTPPPEAVEAPGAASSDVQRKYHQVRRHFARLGVAVICAGAAEPARLILERMDRLRLASGNRGVLR